MVEVTTKGRAGAGAGATVTAIPGAGEAQPRAWLLGPTITLPVLTPSELRSATPCRAPVTCEYPFRLLFAADEPADRTIDWEVSAGISFPAGTDTSDTRIDIKQAADVLPLAEPPTASDTAAGTLTVDATGPQERIVRMRYNGPTPNAWPFRAEAIVHAVRPDAERTPLAQLDLFADIGAVTSSRRVFADYVGPELAILTSPFDGCASGVTCERFLVLHFYGQPQPLAIDWDVEIRARDYESDGSIAAIVSIDELTADEAAAIANMPCIQRAEAAIDMAARLDIIDAGEEARQLARLAAGDWSEDELGDHVFESMCRSLAPTR